MVSEYFDSFDSDKDGRLTNTEMRQLLSKLCAGNLPRVDKIADLLKNNQTKNGSKHIGGMTR
jgi:Ca2+-binding EF-hand superfamily protein